MKKRIISVLLICCLVLSCLPLALAENALTIDMTKWQYNASDNVYWQVGIQYCTNPADPAYESLGIFVPGAYFDAVSNGDGTYTCAVSETGVVGTYTASTAPILFPVNTPGHKAQSAPTGYSKNAPISIQSWRRSCRAHHMNPILQTTFPVPTVWETPWTTGCGCSLRCPI